MSVEVSPESAIGKSLQELVRPKLVELGWSSGLQDDTLSEYIILLLANGQTPEQLAKEISTDLLDADAKPEDIAAFTQWLFEQVTLLKENRLGGAPPTGPAAAGFTDPPDATVDTAMEESEEVHDMRNQLVRHHISTKGAQYANESFLREPPTGPKALRNGPQKGRDKRMLGQMNKTLSQANDGPLHRIRGTAGTGRINTHSSREPPRGPRSQQIQRGLGMGSGRGMNMSMQGTMNGGMMQPPEFMSPGEQMAFYHSMAENARVMAMQIQTMSQAMNSGMLQPSNQQQRPSFDRANRGGRPHARPDRRHGNQAHARGKDTEMAQDGASMDTGAAGETNETNANAKDLSKTVCRFDITCQKADCPYAHHSPIASAYDSLEVIDVENECQFGVACKNKLCKNRHPSRAKKLAQQKEEDCQFGPFCTKFPNCPFKHANVRACRNGADCAVPDCQFWHSKIACKHTPCTHNYCPYKHEPGQKVRWTAANGGPVGNTAERKFVDESAEEEVILPGQARQEGAAKMDEAEGAMGAETQAAGEAAEAADAML